MLRTHAPFHGADALGARAGGKGGIRGEGEKRGIRWSGRAPVGEDLEVEGGAVVGREGQDEYEKGGVGAEGGPEEHAQQERQRHQHHVHRHVRHRLQVQHRVRVCEEVAERHWRFPAYCIA